VFQFFRKYDPAVPGPLEGVRVVELGVWVAGPGAAGILADWGADVVKIEPPDGDPARQFGRMLGGDVPFNPPFELDNRGKRSITVDLTSRSGCEIALQLVDRADVFVTNVRMGALERLGLDPVQLPARNPRLVYAAITGYGMDGAERDRAAYDVGAFWARAGIALMLTAADADPPFQRGGMGDHAVAMTAAGAVCAALLARDRTGEGQLVSTSLLRQGAYTVGFDLNTALRFGVPIATPTRYTMRNPLMSPYRDRDGRWFWLLGLESDRHWPNLARAVGHAEWLDDPRFATAADRGRNCAELLELLDEIFATRTREAWGEVLDREDMWWAAAHTIDEVITDPQMHAAGAFVEIPDGAGTATMIATPADFSGTPWSVRSMPPELGAHTDEVLRELGYDDEAVASLRESGAVI
jgi:crotonobetainyl-CoA:carnitine CoA-transferase CaiB-like acyl-CoA transferase